MNLQTLKKIKTWILIWSLALNYSVFAQNQQPAGNLPVQVIEGPDKFNSTVQQITSAATTAVQQGMMGKWEIEKQAMMYMQGLQNNPVNLQQVGSKLFPNCILPQTRVNRFSENGLCKSEVNDPTMHQQAIQMEKYARDIWNTYENNLVISHSTVASSPSGLTCIQRSSEQVLNELLAKKNEFNTIRSRLELTLKDYLKALEARTQKIADIQNELEGERISSGKSPFWNHTKLYAAFPDCAEAINAKKVNTASSKGLVGLKREFESTIAPAMNVIDGANNNSLAYSAKNQAKEIIRKMKESDINSVAQSMQNEGYSGNQSELKFGSFKNLVKEKNDAFQNNLKRVNNNLKKIGRELPAQDADFQKNLDIKAFDTILKNEYYTTCIGNQSGKKNKVNIWDNITQKEASGAIKKSKNATTNLEIFKTEFKKIFDRSDLTWPQKVTMAKKLEGNQKFELPLNEVYEGRGAKTDWSPSELLESIYKNCETSLIKAPVMGDKTQNDIFNEIKEDLTNIKNDEKNFYADLENSLIDRAINCTGISYDSTSGMCNEDKLDPSKPTFCLAQSRQCAEKISNCFKQIENRQKEVSAKLDLEVQAYNASYNDLETKINQDISLMAEALKFQQSFITARFPGAIESSSAIPNDIFIDFGSPETGVNQLMLIKGGQTKNVPEEVKSKIDKLGTALDNTMTNLKAYLEKEKGQIEANLKKEQEYWQQVKNDCGKQDANYKNKLKKEEEKLAAEQNKAQQEQMKKVQEVCNRKAMFDLIPSCPNISALTGAMVAAGTEFLNAQQQYAQGLRNSITTACATSIENFDSSSYEPKGGDPKNPEPTDGPSEKPKVDLKNYLKDCKGDLPIDKLMKPLTGFISKIAKVLGVKDSEVADSIKEGKFATMVETLPQVLRNKGNAGEIDMSHFMNSYKSKFCRGSEKDKDAANILFNKIHNSLEYIANNARKRGTMTMGENNNGNVNNLHMTGCGAFKTDQKRNSFEDNINSIMNNSGRAGGTKGQ